VEQQLRPDLRGRPVGVVPVMAETTCCIAASYEAKAFGVKTGTNVAEARRLCPDIVMVEARPPVYVDYHHKLVKIIESCIHIDKVLSIDEVICSLLGRQCQREEALKLARHVKAAIKSLAGTELRCSIGIAPNFFLAKTAAEMQKPDGCVVIDHDELPDCLFGLRPGDLYGIGRRMEQRLLEHGIDSVEALCRADKPLLRKVWGGIEGERMFDKLRGKTVYTPPTQRSSIGHSHVLAPDYRTPEATFAVLHKLLQKAAMRLRHYRQLSGRLLVNVDYLEGGGWYEKLNPDPTDDTVQLLKALKLAWNRRPQPMPAPLRVGVVLAKLIDQQQQSLDLFAADRKQAPLNATLDHINERFGRNAIYFGGAHTAQHAAPMRIAFSHIPEPEIEGDK
jgi:DNA polymerase IV